MFERTTSPTLESDGDITRVATDGESGLSTSKKRGNWSNKGEILEGRQKFIGGWSNAGCSGNDPGLN
ncbi:MAG: hypothetical protein WBN92_19920 [Terriglobia bacterium]